MLNKVEIYEEFEKWLDNLLENNDMPENTEAFNFNLYEESEQDNIYGVQIIASDRFDEDDEGEWACCEVWSSEEDIFCADTSDEDDKSRQQALKFITELVCDYLENGKYRDILLGSRAVGIGFVDGDLDLIYKAEQE